MDAGASKLMMISYHPLMMQHVCSVTQHRRRCHYKRRHHLRHRHRPRGSHNNHMRMSVYSLRTTRLNHQSNNCSQARLCMLRLTNNVSYHYYITSTMSRTTTTDMGVIHLSFMSFTHMINNVNHHTPSSSHTHHHSHS